MPAGGGLRGRHSPSAPLPGLAVSWGTLASGTGARQIGRSTEAGRGPVCPSGFRGGKTEPGVKPLNGDAIQQVRGMSPVKEQVEVLSRLPPGKRASGKRALLKRTDVETTHS